MVYKANKYDVPVQFMDLADTSQCGYASSSRVVCDYETNADVNAALKITLPTSVSQKLRYKPSLSDGDNWLKVGESCARSQSQRKTSIAVL